MFISEKLIKSFVASQTLFPAAKDKSILFSLSHHKEGVL